MFYIIVNEETCEGCADCVDICPVEYLDMKDRDNGPGPTGETIVALVVGDMGDCIGCDACVTACPSESLALLEA
ncbi:MAG: 4Fe-4S dicluster domain-containing protein [Anaerolineae bacterium]